MHLDVRSEESGIRSAFVLIRRRWRAIVICTGVAAAMSLAYGLAQTPMYTANATLLAGQGEGIADVTALTAINQATQSLARMSTDRVVIEEALDQLKLRDEIDPLALKARTASSVPANTQQIVVSVSDPDAKRAAQLANGIAQTFSKLVDKKASPNSNLSATVWQPAIVPSAPSSPNIPLLTVLGALIGLVMGGALAAVREALDLRWRDERGVEASLEVPVLAVIPQISSRTARRKVYA